MTKREATQKARTFYKKRVKEYLEKNPFSNEAIEKFGMNLIKREIKFYKSFVKVVYLSENKKFVVFHKERGVLWKNYGLKKQFGVDI